MSQIFPHRDQLTCNAIIFATELNEEGFDIPTSFFKAPDW